MIYLDNAGSTIVDEEVLKLFIEDNTNNFANPSSLNGFGMKENYDIVNYKRDILNILKLNPSTYDVIFTSGATESNNLAILGYARKNKNKGKHLITSKIEHPSVLNVFKELEKEGFDVTYLDIKEDGTIDLDYFKSILRDETILVSLMYVNNECGCVLNLEEIKDIINKSNNKKIVFHSDLAQTLGKEKVNCSLFDMLTISSYKIHGIKGIGALIKKRNIELEPLVYGGGQEFNLRSGTLSYPLIHSFAFIVKKYTKDFEKNYAYVQSLYNFTFDELNKINGIKVHDKFKRHCPFIINFSTTSKESSIVVEALSNKEIYVSTKSSCSSKLKVISHVIYELTKNENEATNSIRISFSKYNTIDEISVFINSLKEILNNIKGR